jgi:ABC-type transport system involved in cytochrome bd biosynthesis fused ATPase/permease subunit
MMQDTKPMDRGLHERLRKRILMFYFAAGVNGVMAVWVISAGAGQVASGTLAIILVMFLAFAALNFYMARVLRKQRDAHVRAQLANRADPAPK